MSGLKDGKYALSIDGKDVGDYTAADLAAGVNLGNLDSGPLFEQGQEVFKVINEKERPGTPPLPRRGDEAGRRRR